MLGLLISLNFLRHWLGPNGENAFSNIYPLHEMNHQPFAMTKPFQKALSWNVVVSSPQYSENNGFYPYFFADGSMAGGFYWHYSMWLFHLHSAVENTAFFPVFPLAESTAKAFFRLSLWNFKEKTSIFFYNTAILLVTPLEFRESASHFLWHGLQKHQESGCSRCEP